jgi:predicted RNase H-like HicB family nuclease
MNNERRTLVFEQKHDGWIGYAPVLPDTYAHGSTLEEVRESLSEAVRVASRADDGEQVQNAARDKDVVSFAQR